MGKGNILSFWKDNWAGKSPLREVFHNDALVNGYYNENNGVPQWSISFTRTLRVFEEDHLQTLERLLGDN